MKLAVVLGTRPEVIKLAPLISELKKRSAEITVISTGQHGHLLTQALELFDIQPDINLNSMSAGQSLTSLGSKLLAELEPIFSGYRPDFVFVQGDTSSAFFGALAAFNQGLKVAHIEAGMRTGDISSPFPEEANRKMISCLSSIHFSATNRAKLALLKEGIKEADIFVSGNTIVDAIELAQEFLKKDRGLLTSTRFLSEGRRPYVFITCHRRENFGLVMDGICLVIKKLAAAYTDLDFIFPVHPNPNVSKPVGEKLQSIENIRLIEPLDYLSTIDFIRNARLIITDSGGIQEEAPSFAVPVIVMRNVTERMEGVHAGLAELAGQEPLSIISKSRKWLDNQHLRLELKNKKNPYGDGQASSRIVSRVFNEHCCEFEL